MTLIRPHAAHARTLPPRLTLDTSANFRNYRKLIAFFLSFFCGGFKMGWGVPTAGAVADYVLPPPNQIVGN